jgi:putative SOS response-associated peptidase YedK
MVVRRHPETGERHLNALRWGLIPYYEKDPKGGRKPTNARAETVATTGLFRAAFARRRCLVPAETFYEWQKRPDGMKQPYAIAREDGEVMAFAGLWEGWRAPDGETVRTFAIVTTDANAGMAELQDRMPVILEHQDWPLWLGEVEGDPTALLHWTSVRDTIGCASERKTACRNSPLATQLRIARFTALRMSDECWGGPIRKLCQSGSREHHVQGFCERLLRS